MWGIRKTSSKTASEAMNQEASRGSIGVIFAILVASGVLIGLIGLAFDTGIAYQEQQTLRIASTAASKGLATKCAMDEPQCEDQSSASVLVQQLLNANSKDEITAIDEVCGSSPLNACQPLTTRPQDCEPVGAGENFVRVTAKTQTPSGTTIGSVFAQLLGGSDNPSFESQLWYCSQASWVSNAQTESQIAFNMLMPSCDYPGSSAPFVTHNFIDQGNNPAIPRETSCTLQADGAGPIVTLIDVMHGFAPFEALVGACDSDITVQLNDVVFDNGNDKKFCGGSVGSIGDWIQESIDNNASVPVALAGAIDNPSANNWYFEVIGFTNYKFLGYRISNSIQGGTTPPGGWSAYPQSSPNNARCAASRPCFYGYYVDPPSFLTDGVTVQIIE